jgi:hypothetical protein
MADQATALDHTCERCEVTASWMPGTLRPELPTGWTIEGADVYCLNCRRERAAEAADVDEETPAAERTRVRSHARIEFEIRRDPELPDNRVAKVCRTSTMAVRKVRAKIGVAAPPRP